MGGKINIGIIMDMVETRVLSNDWEVRRRIAELSLDYESLLEVVHVAMSASADSTLYHPANAAGTFAYQHGTWSLRNEFVGEDWEIDRIDSVEAIRNDSKRIKVVYSNVDIACNADQKPKPRSRKGAGSERVCNSGNLFDDLPEYAPAQDEEYSTYFLMVDANGAAELTRPVIKNGTYDSYIERIWLCDGDDGLHPDALLPDSEDVADDFDPQVVRK